MVTKVLQTAAGRMIFARPEERIEYVNRGRLRAFAMNLRAM